MHVNNVNCLLWFVFYVILNAAAKPSRSGPNEHVSVFVYSPSSSTQEPSLDNWTQNQQRDLKRLKRAIIRQTTDGRFIKDVVEGILLHTEIGNNEVFVPEELIVTTKKLLTVVQNQLNNDDGRNSVRRDKKDAEAQEMPFSFQYIVDDELTQNFQTRQEEGDSMGVVRGCYQLLEPNGMVRTVIYQADSLGFKVVSVTKGPDKIPCSGSNDEGFQTPFQKAFLPQNTKGKTLSSSSNKKAPLNRRPQQTRQEQTNGRRKLEKFSQAKNNVTPEKQPQPLETVSPTNARREEDSIVSYINNLSETLFQSFKSIDSKDASNYVNFPFVLIPISTFFQLRQQGHIADDVQGFGAVIQTVHGKETPKSLQQNASPQEEILDETNQRLLSKFLSEKSSIRNSKGPPEHRDRSSNIVPSDNINKHLKRPTIFPASNFEETVSEANKNPLEDSLSSQSQLATSLTTNFEDFESPQNAKLNELKNTRKRPEITPENNLRKENQVAESNKFGSAQFETDASPYSNYKTEELTEDQNLVEIKMTEFDSNQPQIAKTIIDLPTSINGFEVPAISVLPLEYDHESDLLPHDSIESPDSAEFFEVPDQQAIESKKTNQILDTKPQYVPPQEYDEVRFSKDEITDEISFGQKVFQEISNIPTETFVISPAESSKKLSLNEYTNLLSPAENSDSPSKKNGNQINNFNKELSDSYRSTNVDALARAHYYPQQARTPIAENNTLSLNFDNKSINTNFYIAPPATTLVSDRNQNKKDEKLAQNVFEIYQPPAQTLQVNQITNSRSQVSQSVKKNNDHSLSQLYEGPTQNIVQSNQGAESNPTQTKPIASYQDNEKKVNQNQAQLRQTSYEKFNDQYQAPQQDLTNLDQAQNKNPSNSYESDNQSITQLYVPPQQNKKSSQAANENPDNLLPILKDDLTQPHVDTNKGSRRNSHVPKKGVTELYLVATQLKNLPSQMLKDRLTQPQRETIHLSYSAPVQGIVKPNYNSKQNFPHSPTASKKDLVLSNQASSHSIFPSNQRANQIPNLAKPILNPNNIYKVSQSFNTNSTQTNTAPEQNPHVYKLSSQRESVSKTLTNQNDQPLEVQNMKPKQLYQGPESSLAQLYQTPTQSSLQSAHKSPSQSSPASKHNTPPLFENTKLHINNQLKTPQQRTNRFNEVPRQSITSNIPTSHHGTTQSFQKTKLNQNQSNQGPEQGLIREKEFHIQNRNIHNQVAIISTPQSATVSNQNRAQYVQGNKQILTKSYRPQKHTTPHFNQAPIQSLFPNLEPQSETFAQSQTNMQNFNHAVHDTYYAQQAPSVIKLWPTNQNSHQALQTSQETQPHSLQTSKHRSSHVHQTASQTLPIRRQEQVRDREPTQSYQTTKESHHTANNAQDQIRLTQNLQAQKQIPNQSYRNLKLRQSQSFKTVIQSPLLPSQINNQVPTPSHQSSNHNEASKPSSDQLNQTHTISRPQQTLESKRLAQTESFQNPTQNVQFLQQFQGNSFRSQENKGISGRQLKPAFKNNLAPHFSPHPSQSQSHTKPNYNINENKAILPAASSPRPSNLQQHSSNIQNSQNQFSEFGQKIQNTFPTPQQSSSYSFVPKGTSKSRNGWSPMTTGMEY